MPGLKKKIFINAATVKISGGLTVALSSIEALYKKNCFELFLICPKTKDYLVFEEKIDKMIYVPELLLNKFFRAILDLYWLPSKIKKTKPDLVLSLGNIPAITTYYQIYLHDNPYLTHSIPKGFKTDTINLLTHKIRVFLTLRRFKYNNEIWTQTSLEKNLIIKQNRFFGTIKTLAPLVPSHLLKGEQSKKVLPNKEKGTIRLICLSNYFEHKNLNILLDVARLAIKINFKLQFIFTINSFSDKKSKNLLNKINTFPNQYALNIGHVKYDESISVINQCDGVILPSLMETFGLNCFDAWINQKPYFISNMDYAREVCKDAAIYFDPTSELDILKKIKDTFDNKNQIKKLVLLGQKRLELWPTSDIFIKEIQKKL